MNLSGRGGRPTGGRGVNPRWPSPRKESIKCKGGRRMQEDTGLFWQKHKRLSDVRGEKMIL